VIDEAAIVAAARSHVGTRYRDRSAQAGRSLCCFGLVMVVAEQVGAVCPNLHEFDRPSLELIQAEAHQWFDELSEPRRGAVVLIAPGRLTLRRPLLHWAIITDRSKFEPYGFVHSCKAAGRVEETPWTCGWQRRVRGYYGLREAA
jgi:hypothetical protein